MTEQDLGMGISALSIGMILLGLWIFHLHCELNRLRREEHDDFIRLIDVIKKLDEKKEDKVDLSNAVYEDEPIDYRSSNEGTEDDQA